MVWIVVVWQGLVVSAALGGKYKGPFCPQALSSKAVAKPIHTLPADFFIFDMVKL
jgi:hypothetical protein